MTDETLLRTLATHARQRAADVFLTHYSNGHEKHYTFSEVYETSLIYAAAYTSKKLAPRSVVFISLKHCPELYFSFLGAMLAGLIPSFLPFPTHKQDRRLFWSGHADLFERTRASAIVTFSENVQPVLQVTPVGFDNVYDIEHLVPHDWQSYVSSLPSTPSAASVAFLQHSSGTTGLKKGVMISYADLQRQADSYAKAIKFSASDIVVSWLPLYHDMGLLSSFLIPLIIGSAIVSIDAFEWVSKPMLLLNLIERHGGTLCWLPNFALNHIAKNSRDEKPNLSTLRSIIVCSEPCKKETFDQFSLRFESCGITKSKLSACYAMAETVFCVTQSNIEEDYKAVCVDGDLIDSHGEVKAVPCSHPSARTFISNGRVISDLVISISSANKNGNVSQQAASTTVGEVLVKGAFVTQGYYNNSTDTQTAFIEDWYRTGDIGFILENDLYICGRLKEIIIVHGRNYFANDIEAIVSNIPGVKPGRAVAFSIFSKRT